jgi:hypothetical protein
MTTALTSTFPTLLDYAKRVDPDGGIADVIEVLAQSNPILSDASIIEGNLPTGHRSTQRSTQPTGSWRLLNQGVAPEKSTTKQVDDTCGILEAYSKIDVDLAMLNGNEAAFRASEDDAFVAGLSSTAATAIMEGNSLTDPEQPHGLLPRYNSLTTGYTTQTISASGSGSDNTSIWLVTWGPKTCTLIYPKGSKAGLVSDDLGKQLITDSSGYMYQAYVSKFQWKLGLALMDYRYVLRICNIDVSDLTTDASAGADLITKMVHAYFQRPTELIGNPNMARTYWYCNKTIAEYLTVQASNKANVNLTMSNAGGEPIVNFYGAPVRICDAIGSDESPVS